MKKRFEVIKKFQKLRKIQQKKIRKKQLFNTVKNDDNYLINICKTD